MKIITLLTDFGTADGYVSAMKAVALSACPDAHVVDATHDIRPHDTRAGAWALRHYWRLYPEETIHVAVVDPGVGSSRRALIACADRRWLIGPDNGIFSWVLREARRAEVCAIRPTARRRDAVGNTFHGRDVFAHVAGLLAAGTPVTELAGQRIEPVRFEWPKPQKRGAEIRGAVIHIDRFGNSITNIPAAFVAKLGPRLTVSCATFMANRIASRYSEVPSGEPVALIESTGLLELAIREGSAAEKFGIRIGSQVMVKKA